MSKIKVAQIVNMGDDQNPYIIDAEGRVWYDNGYSKEFTANDFTTRSEWVTVWTQLELPEEPG